MSDKSMQDKVSKLVDEVTNKGKVLLDEGIESAKEILEKKTQHLKEKAEDLELDEWAEKTATYVKKNPLKSVGIAAVAGFLAALILRPRD